MEVVVVVPVYKSVLSESESISAEVINFHLSGYDIKLACPDGLQAPERLKRYDKIVFEGKYFESIKGYNSLLLRRDFYEAFVEYRYILICQLDCLVFSSRLDHWCRQGYDYIGAPLKLKNERGISKYAVGNGGLSLRRVSSFLKVLESAEKGQGALNTFTRLCFDTPPDIAAKNMLPKIRKIAGTARSILNGTNPYTERYSMNEDLFWSFRAALFNPAFRIPMPEIACGFSIEKEAQYWINVNGGGLPFGCHAWNKYDREFWTKHIPEKILI